MIRLPYKKRVFRYIELNELSLTIRQKKMGAAVGVIDSSCRLCFGGFGLVPARQLKHVTLARRALAVP